MSYCKGLLLTCVMLLSACGGGGGGGASNPIPEQTSVRGVSPYLPTSPDVQLYYDNNSIATHFDGQRTISNESFDVMAHPSGAREYLAVDKDSIALRGFYSPLVNVSGVGNFTADVTLDRNVPIWSSDMLDGTSRVISGNGQLVLAPTYGAISVTFSATQNYVGKEAVTVPLGTFDTLRIRLDMNISGTVNGVQFEVPFKTELWFAKDVGIVKRIENGTPVQLTDYIGLDSDNDGTMDFRDQFPDDPSESVDTDGDGTGDNADTDDDNDGVPDDQDELPKNPAETSDFDGDGIGDNADTDDDNDGVADDQDAFPKDWTETSDFDGDGVGDNADTDDDNDGVADDQDAFPKDATETSDFDGDGVGDNADTDDDNDGFDDDIDLYPLDKLHNEPLAVDKADLVFSGVLGSSVAVASQTLTIQGNNLDWSISSDAGWLSVDHASGYSDGSVQVSVDVSGLASGPHLGTLLLESGFSGEQIAVYVKLNLALPTLTTSSSTLLFDNRYGWQDMVKSVELSLNTGSNTYSWSASVSFAPADSMSVDAYGSVNSVASSVNLAIVSSSDFSEGLHQGTVTYTATILGEQVSTTVDVSVIASKHVIYVPDNGVAFTSFPSVSSLSKHVKVLDSYELTDTPWSAVSDQSWLSVTATGTTADDLVLTADPGSLGSNALHMAQVTITSGSSAIENSETIYVGLWIGDTDPDAQASVAVGYTDIAADPVRPYVYVHGSGDSFVTIYNIYQRTVVGSITGLGSQLGDMEVSADGQTLFVVNNYAPEIVKVNLNDFTTTNFALSKSTLYGFTLARNKGQPLLLAEYGQIYDAVSGQAVSGGGFEYGHPIKRILDASLFGNRFCGIDSGLSPFSLDCYEMSYSSYDSSLHLQALTGAYGYIGSNGQDVALNSDGTTLYIASGGPYVFNRLSLPEMTLLSSLTADAYPTAVEMGDDDALHGGISGWYGPLDLWIYERDGSLRKSAYVSGYAKNILARQLVVSGDGYMTIVSTNDPVLSFVSSYP